MCLISVAEEYIRSLSISENTKPLSVSNVIQSNVFCKVESQKEKKNVIKPTCIALWPNQIPSRTVGV